MIDQLRAMAGQAAAPIVRVPAGEDWILKRALDIGVQTVMVPMVETGAQARQVVRAMRYPPEGVRGVGSALARASHYSLEADYVATANAQICTIVQIESLAAVKAIPEIAAVEGVDVLFIGPADLAADMGYTGQPDAPEVDDVILSALSKIDRSGKVPGVLAFNGTDAERFARAGARFLGVGADVTSLAAALKALSSEAHALLRQR